MYILLQNNHNRQNYLRRQANATISLWTKKTEETGTLTTLSLSACNIYVRAAHRAQGRTIFGELPVNDQKRKQTKTQVALSLHRRHRRTLMTSNGRQTQNKCTKKKVKRSTATESMCSPFQHPSRAPRERQHSGRGKLLRAWSAAVEHADNEAGTKAAPLHNSDCTHRGCVTVREDRPHFAAAPARVEKEVVNGMQLRRTRTIRLTRRLQ